MLFLVRFFLHISNTGKYGPEITPYLDTSWSGCEKYLLNMSFKLKIIVFSLLIKNLAKQKRTQGNEKKNGLYPRMSWVFLFRLFSINGSRYSRMDQEKFAEDTLWKNWSGMVCLSRPYHLEFLQGIFFKFFEFYLVHSWISCPKYSKLLIVEPYMRKVKKWKTVRPCLVTR